MSPQASGRPDARLITTRQLCEKLSCSRTTLWRLRTAEESTFPSPVRLGSSLRWIELEIDIWLGQLSDAASSSRLLRREGDGAVA